MKRLIVLIALAAMAGSASAAVFASQDFDGGATGTGAWTYESNINTNGGNASVGGGIESDSKAYADLNSSIDAGSDGAAARDLWFSYRMKMEAHSQYLGSSAGFGVGFGRTDEVDHGRQDRIGFVSDGKNSMWGDYHPAIWIGSERFTDTNSVAINYNEDEDLFVVGKFSYAANGDRTFYMITTNWLDRGTLTESDVTAGFSATWVDPDSDDFNNNTDTTIDYLTFKLVQPSTGSTSVDVLVAGDTFDDVSPDIFLPTEVPSAPSDLVATAVVGGISIDLTWTDASTNEYGFVVERSPNGGGYSMIASNIAGAAYTDIGLSPFTEYFYRVSAYNNIGSSTGNPTTSETTLQGPPSGLFITNKMPHVITFDETIPGVCQVADGTTSGGVMEPEAWRRSHWNTAKPYALASEAFVMTGRSSTSVRFGDDGNNNGTIGDETLSGNDCKVFDPTFSGLSSAAVRITADDVHMNEGKQFEIYLRIQNKTGAAVDTWNFAMDYYYSDATANGDVSHIEFGYAVDVGIEPSLMTFTPFATGAAVNDGVDVLAHHQLDEAVTATVADGDFIILSVIDTTSLSGAEAASDVWLDNITVNAGGVYVPPSASVMGINISGTESIVSWTTEPGFMYSVYSSTNLVDGDGFTLMGEYNSTVTSMTNAVTPATPAIFYQIKAQ